MASLRFAVRALAMLSASASAAVFSRQAPASQDPAAAALRGAASPQAVSAANATASTSSLAPQCGCQKADPSWATPTRTVPKCIFIDLGAADGNSFASFLSDKYGPVANCPNGQYEAWLVEANPGFSAKLQAVQGQHPNQVHALGAHAAYMCEGQTSFHLDLDPTHNHWGSSMGRKLEGGQMVTVPTVNVIRMLHEKTIPGDWVMIKMDIEGAEWDVLPCLAEAADASLVDRLFMEVHPAEWSSTGTTQAVFDKAKATLKSKGVDIPDYFSQTL
eukprot:TRINITY_DN775_c0_g2_i1.p1 TRINITY_DN775_c0_g2~~TRINITY_DN775_c0_g2_i1.p1  ORF type:complete len:274 (-),score=73.01 TRINITY_DN775_c0_g2_i1:88-909(-)